MAPAGRIDGNYWYSSPNQQVTCYTGHLTAIVAILAQPGVEPRNFMFTENAAVELRERILSILEMEGLDTFGLVEVYVGTMYG